WGRCRGRGGPGSGPWRSPGSRRCRPRITPRRRGWPLGSDQLWFGGHPTEPGPAAHPGAPRPPVTNSRRGRPRREARSHPGRDRAGAYSGQQLSEKVVSMRLVRTLLVASLVAVVLALAATPAGAQRSPTPADPRAAGHPGFDRVVFEFQGDVPEHTVRYVDQLVEDGTGEPVSVAGTADLEVVFPGANAHGEDGTPSGGPRW